MDADEGTEEALARALGEDALPPMEGLPAPPLALGEVREELRRRVPVAAGEPLPALPGPASPPNAGEPFAAAPPLVVALTLLPAAAPPGLMVAADDDDEEAVEADEDEVKPAHIPDAVGAVEGTPAGILTWSSKVGHAVGAKGATYTLGSQAATTSSDARRPFRRSYKAPIVTCGEASTALMAVPRPTRRGASVSVELAAAAAAARLLAWEARARTSEAREVKQQHVQASLTPSAAA